MAEIILLVITLALLIKPLGTYMAQVYEGKPTFLDKFFVPIERLIYRLIGVDAEQEMGWQKYASTAIWLAVFCFIGLYSMLIWQSSLPLNPLAVADIKPDLAFNIAMSFLTSTDWQSYTGEQALSPFSQTVGIITQMFLSPAADMAVAAALFRGFKLRNSKTIGNFWKDMVRSIVFILMPISLLFSAIYLTQGVVQSVVSVDATTLTGDTQTIITGPVAAQVSIKQLGTNGGGYFGVNSAHPFENPTALSNFISLLAILLIPAAFTYTFGIMVGDRRQGVMILSVMSLLVAGLVAVAISQEQHIPPALAGMGIDAAQGNMEGKEMRHGATLAALWSVLATSTANGSAIGAHASMMPLTILCQLIPMKLGAILFGGVGAGMLNMLMMVLVTIFMAGLMVGRTPEFLGKKLGPFEMKIAMLIFIVPGISVLIGTSLALSTSAGMSVLSTQGTQGYVQALYAFTSAAYNNGSAVGGFNADNTLYNILLGVAMFIGNYFVQVASVAIAGSMAIKNLTPPTPSTLHTHTPIFACMLILVLLISVLVYSPALVIGPIVDHLTMVGGAS
jgi:K+-transporting ATPase ATPase A chain